MRWYHIVILLLILLLGRQRVRFYPIGIPTQPKLY